MSKVPQSLCQRTALPTNEAPTIGGCVRGWTWKVKVERGKKGGHTHLIFPLCMEQLSSSVQAHRRIGLKCQRPIVQLERIIWIFETFVDLV